MSTASSGRTIAWQRQALGPTRVDGDVTVTRRRVRLRASWAYPALALMVLVGLAAMHGGAAATPAGGHGPLAMSAHAVADSRHAAAAAPRSVDAGAAALTSFVAKHSAHRDGDTAGCVLAFSGILGLALACLARRRARDLVHLRSAISSRRALGLRQRYGPVPGPGPDFLLCVHGRRRFRGRPLAFCPPV